MKKVILWTCCLAWLALLIHLSSQDGPGTARTSLALTRFLMRALRLPPGRLAMLNTGLRAAAHFVCFFGLGVLLCAAMSMTLQKMGNIHFWAAGICAAIGALDEVKKVFISGRHLSFEEAGLNVIGALCGIIAVLIVMELASSSPKAGTHGGNSKVKSNTA